MSTVTVPDVIIDNTEYVDVMAASGIAPGTKVRLQNKGGHQVHVQFGPDKPHSGSRDGFCVSLHDHVLIEAEDNIWCIADSSARVNLTEAV